VKKLGDICYIDHNKPVSHPYYDDHMNAHVRTEECERRERHSRELSATFNRIVETGPRCDHGARRGACGDVDCPFHTDEYRTWPTCRRTAAASAEATER